MARYEAEAAGLGEAFAREVEAAVALIRDRPEIGTPLGNGLHRWRRRRFPYSVIYTLEPNRLFVLAVAHQRQRPDYWREWA